MHKKSFVLLLFLFFCSDTKSHSPSENINDKSLIFASILSIYQVGSVIYQTHYPAGFLQTGLFGKKHGKYSFEHTTSNQAEQQPKFKKHNKEASKNNDETHLAFNEHINQLDAILKRHKDINFIWVTSIHDTLFFEATTVAEHQAQQDMLVALNNIKEENSNFIIVYITNFDTLSRTGGEPNSILNNTINIRNRSNTQPPFHQNITMLKVDSEESDELPKHYGIPVPHLIVSQTGMKFEINSSLLTEELRHSVDRTNTILFEKTRQYTQLLKDSMPGTHESASYNSNLTTVFVFVNERTIGNWKNRIIPSLQTGRAIQAVTLNEVSQSGTQEPISIMFNLYLVNEGTGLRIAIEMLRKAGLLKQETVMFMLGSKHSNLPFIRPDLEIASLGATSPTAEIQRGKDIECINSNANMSVPELPTLDLTDGNPKWLTSTVLNDPEHESNLLEIKNETIDRSLQHPKVVQITGGRYKLLAKAFEEIVKKLSGYLYQDTKL
ncbi:hypothetical protein [Endozoicomonas lisbonensis]|uniref:Uncharacterized protein n=1 Tax=Endozoicomonas lisbonensis TaxID=3120522 RepID=A0ABV2SHW1_9GAMM